MTEQLLSLPPLATATAVCCYIALPDEVETRPLIETLWQRGVRVSAPKIVGAGQLVAVPIQAWTDLAPGRFGILEPHATRPIQTRPQVIIVPGRAFTLRGDRQGRGHGYYDRFLAAYPAAARIALARESQTVESLPTRAHDEPVDWLVTESRSIETHARRARKGPH